MKESFKRFAKFKPEISLDTINTIVISSMVVFGAAFGEVIYIDVAIVYALLSFISTLFIAKYIEGGDY